MKYLLAILCVSLTFSCSQKSGNNQEAAAEPEAEINTVPNNEATESIEVLETEEEPETITFTNPRYVLADKLNVRRGPTLSDDVIKQLVMGDSIEFLEERDDKILDIMWQGKLTNGYMRKIQLNDGNFGWVYGPMIGRKVALEGHTNAQKLRGQFPDLVAYEGWYPDYQTDPQTKERYIMNACECGETGISIGFHLNGYKLDHPAFTAYGCGEAYGIEISKIKKTTYNGIPALLLEGKNGNKTITQITIFNTTIDGKKVLGYQYEESDKPIYVVSDKLKSQFETRDENCDELYEGY